ncbi:MAG TPA: hypothetical protein VK506_09090 [Conexibacter sp.]|nr:hypothetical protein [Conexibacter sp.]
MSTSEPRPDDLMRRYRDGLPPRDPSERETFAEWGQLDADDRASAFEEQNLASQYEHYGGPLSWRGYLAEHRRGQDLESLGYSPPEIPDKYADALGPDRVASLERAIEDRFLAHASSPPTREELSAAAREFGAAARALGVESEAGAVDPDGWLQEHGETFTDALAAQQMFRRDRELPDSERLHDQPEPDRTAIAQAVDAALDAGLDPF